MLRLVAKCGDALRRHALREDGEVTLGSAEGNDFVIPFPGVSRRHARAARNAAGVRIVDLDSKNGLVVGTRRRRQVDLRPGESVLLGRAMISLETVADSDLELALVLDREVRNGEAPGKRWRSGETAPHWALHLVRELDHLSPDTDEARRADLLGRTADAVGADGLWTFAVVENDYFLRDFVGAVPSDEAVERLTALALGTVEKGGGEARAPVELDGPRGPVLACPPPSGEGLLLVATFPPERAPAGWVGDLMTHVAELLRSIDSGPSHDDIPGLVLHFALQAGLRYGKRIRGVGRRALDRIQAHRWDGRLRELEHAVTGAVLRCPDGEGLEAGHFVELDDPPPADPPGPEDTQAIAFAPLAARLEATEREAIVEALDRADGDRNEAAKLLGITPEELAEKLVRFGLDAG